MDEARVLHVDRSGGTHLWGPRDRDRILVPGEQTDGADCVLEGFVPPDGGVQHSFSTACERPARMTAAFAPAGTESWFPETLDPCDDPTAPPPPTTEAPLARMAEAGPGHAVEWASDVPAGE
jgi:hypothetical protein